MKELLPGGHFPKPTPGELQEFMRWDDWRVLGMLADGQGGEHGERLAARNHYRMVYQTGETQTESDRAKLARVREALGGFPVVEMSTGKSWYKTKDADSPVLGNGGGQKRIAPLSELSSVVRNLGSADRILLYCRPGDRTEAERKVQEAIN